MVCSRNCKPFGMAGVQRGEGQARRLRKQAEIRSQGTPTKWKNVNLILQAQRI